MPPSYLVDLCAIIGGIFFLMVLGIKSKTSCMPYYLAITPTQGIFPLSIFLSIFRYIKMKWIFNDSITTHSINYMVVAAIVVTVFGESITVQSRLTWNLL